MSRSSGTGLLRSHSLSLFNILFFFIVSIHSRTVLAAPIFKDIHRRNGGNTDSNITVLCTKSTTTTSNTAMITSVKTIIETRLATETEVLTKTVVDGGSGGSGSSIVVETTSILTTVQSSGPIVSDIGTEPGAVFTTPGYTTIEGPTYTSTVPSSTLSRPAITMIASPPVAVAPTNQPEQRPPAPSSDISTTLVESTTPISTSSEPSTSTIVPTTSLEPSTSSTSTPITSTSISSSTIPETSTSMASTIIIPIETLQPSLDSDTTTLPAQSSTTDPTTTITTSTSLSSSSPLSTSSSNPPKTGYILTGIVLVPQPSDLPAAQSTRIQLDGGVSMPTSTGGAQRDLNGPPELVFRGDAGRSINFGGGIKLWSVTGVVAVLLGVIVI
ncbi:hypothetical protein TWF281_004505 [Arthrobotrys megalospora]